MARRPLGRTLEVRPRSAPSLGVGVLLALAACADPQAGEGLLAVDGGVVAPGPSCLSGPVAGDFTIVLLPDTQYYAAGYPATYRAQTQWIVRQADALQVAFVIHLGDMTNDDTAAQWAVANEALGVLDAAGVPWSPMPGNHDGIDDGVIATEGYNATFPAEPFARRPWYGATSATETTRPSGCSLRGGSIS